MTKLRALHGDITRIQVDAIVNAANSGLRGGGGVDGAIHRAGGPVILTECQLWVASHGSLPTGESMVTTGGLLPARHVIHTVGPVWSAHTAEESRRLLARCYESSLEAATDLGVASLAFPNISTGVFGFPKAEAAPVAIGTVTSWLGSNDSTIEDVVFVCHDSDNYGLYVDLLSD